MTVVEAISSLSLKVENWGKHHATLEQLAFEDDDVRKTVLVMKETKNIRQLADVSETIQFFTTRNQKLLSFVACLVSRCIWQLGLPFLTLVHSKSIALLIPQATARLALAFY